MDSVSYLLLVIWKSKLRWGSWKYHCGEDCISVQRIFSGQNFLGMLCSWVTEGLGRHIIGAGASLCQFMACRITFLSLSFLWSSPKFLTFPFFWPMLLGPAWKETDKSAKIPFRHIFFDWLSRVLGEALRPCFGVQTQNPQHPAHWQQLNADTPLSHYRFLPKRMRY